MAAVCFSMGYPSAMSMAGASTSLRLMVPNSASITNRAPGVPGVVAASGPYPGGKSIPLLLKNSGVAPVGASPCPLMANTFFLTGS